MRLSGRQKMLLHRVPAALGIADEDRRLIQRNIGGAHSAADEWTREGFIAVMAFYEVKAGGRLDGFSAGYWRDQDRTASPLDALRHRIRRQAELMGWSEPQVDALLAGPRMSGGRHERLADAPAYWLSRLLEAMKAMHGRNRRERLY